MDNNTPFVLFICEHGSAKSVIAATHFNRQAKEKGLEIRAISRGTDPDDEIPPSVLQGLEADGLPTADMKPSLLRNEDVLGAIRIVSFCSLPLDIETKSPYIPWENVPSVSDNYGTARDEIVKRIAKLLDVLNKIRV